MQPDPDLDPERTNGAEDRACTGDAGGRAVEPSEEAVAGGIQLPALMPVEARTHKRMMALQQLGPPSVPQGGRASGRIHDVGEEQRREEPTGLEVTREQRAAGVTETRSVAVWAPAARAHAARKQAATRVAVAGAGPVWTAAMRAERHKRKPLTPLAVPKMVGPWQCGGDVALGHPPGEWRERLELGDEDVAVAVDPFVAATGEQ